MKEIYVGVDIGSATVKVVGLDAEAGLTGSTVYLRHDEFPTQVDALKEAMRRFTSALGEARLRVGTTGSGRELNRALLDAVLTRTEIFAHAVGIKHLVSTGIVPVESVGCVIEIGGQDSKVIVFDADGNPAYFNMNSICSAGTGEFLKQLSDEARIDVADFGDIALRSRQPARIDSTCTVFSRRDFRHLTQKGVPLPDRLMGVAKALVNNYMHNVVHGQALRPPVIFQGGVAFNSAVKHAFEKRLHTPIIVPPYNDVVGALGMALLVRDHCLGRGDVSDGAFDPAFFDRHVSSRLRYCHGCQNGCELTQPVEQTSTGELRVLDTLGGRCEGHRNPDNVHAEPREEWSERGLVRIDATRYEAPPVLLSPGTRRRACGTGRYFGGIDGGSRATKWALVQSGGKAGVRVVAVGCVDTAGDAVRAVTSAVACLRDALRKEEAVEQLGAIGTTGSAGELAQHIISERTTDTADYRTTEIIAHYTWAREQVPDVGTVLDIGGNDAKLITVDRTGLDFAMNDKCAAGTGSFLESVARRLNVELEAYGDVAARAEVVSHIAGRCAVFGESDVVHKTRLGFATPDLLAGVAHSVARTYLSDVAKGRILRLPIVAQGGVFLNGAVEQAFRRLLGVDPGDFFVARDARLVIGAGALGAAVLARNMYQQGFPSTFKGFGRVLESDFSTRSVTCRHPGCNRKCRGLTILTENGRPIAGYKSIDCPLGLFDGQVTPDYAAAGIGGTGRSGV